MADIRVTTGRRSREQGTTVGFQTNVFGLAKLQVGVTGEAIAPILLEALQPALIDAKAVWPILTGASISTMKTVVVEIGPKDARANLQVGGPELIAHPDNPSKKDYAPFIEFNGSPSGRGKGALSNAFFGNDREMRRILHEGVSALVRGILA